MGMIEKYVSDQVVKDLVEGLDGIPGDFGQKINLLFDSLISGPIRVPASSNCELCRPAQAVTRESRRLRLKSPRFRG